MSRAGARHIEPGNASVELLERDEQLSRLTQALAMADAGQGRIVAIAGEAGAGKTSLAEQFVRGNARHAIVHWGTCENLSTPEVLLPLRDIARAAGRPLDTGGDQLQWFEWVLRLLGGAELPSIMVIEDLHWADTATLDLLRFLARRIGPLRALLLITYRDEESGPRSPIRQLLGEAVPGSIERMSLQPLSLISVSQLAAKAGRSGADIFALTAGNPFLVTETLAAADVLPSEAVRDATLARVSRLSAAARGLIEAVSIFPRRVETSIVAELVSAAFETSLDECIEKGMLLLEGGLLRFRHELARRAVEESIAPGQRRELHRKVVRELRLRQASRASEIAHHAERAGEIPTLIECSRLAGDEAAGAGAPREAAAHYAAMLRHREFLDAPTLVKALESYAEQCYLMGDPTTAMRFMIEAAGRRREAGERIALGRDLTRLTRFAWMSGRRLEAERYVQEAIEVLQAEAPGAELAWALSHHSQLEMLAFRMRSAIRFGEQALALGRELGEPEIIVHALGNVGSARADLETDAPCSELELGFDLAVAGRYHDHVERAACNLSCIHYWRRDYPASLAHIERGVAYAVARDLNHWEGYLRGWRAMIRLDMGEWAAAEEEALEISSRQSIGDVYRFPAFIALARLRLRRSDPDSETPLEAAGQISASLSELQRTVYVAATRAESFWLSADEPGGTAAHAPQRAQVLAQLREVHQRAEGSALWIAEAMALWLYVLGERDFSTAHFSAPFRDHCEGRWRAAADGWRALGQGYEQALALSGGDETAQCEALEIWDRLGAVAAATRLRRTMRAAGVRSVPRGPIAGTRANSAGLTRRQTRVLELVGEGMTNAEIAERLCISAKTAEHHVSAIMARFDAGSRREAVAAARKHGLLDAKDGGGPGQK